jgi:hypothetical protein
VPYASNDRRQHSRRRDHVQRHRDMARFPAVELDCILEQIDAAEFAGDEYLAALLRKAADRLTRWIPAR